MEMLDRQAGAALLLETEADPFLEVFDAVAPDAQFEDVERHGPWFSGRRAEVKHWRSRLHKEWREPVMRPELFAIACIDEAANLATVGAILKDLRFNVMLKCITAAILASCFIASAAFAASNDYTRRHNDRSDHHQSQSHHSRDRYDNDRHDRDRDHRSHRERRHDRHHSRYRAGEHYRSAPHGWHRYHRRPHDWRTRGCIVVGPLWFCP
jgi:hypothetical protein